MKRFLLAIIIAALGSTPGCGKKGPPPTTDRYADPAFKAAQREKAVKAYEELLEKYPDSEFAPRAKQRLEVLQK